MKAKIALYLAVLVFLTTGTLRAQDTATIKPVADTTASAQVVRDTTAVPVQDTLHPVQVATTHDTTLLLLDSTYKPPADSPADVKINTIAVDPGKKDATPAKDTTAAVVQNDVKPAQDSTAKSEENSVRQLDTRWFISPLLKGQYQDFGMLEKNRKGYLSNANTLSPQQRGNMSFAASAYKNLTSRLSVSADLGLSFGHVTSNNVLIANTPYQTFNLLNLTAYYHLLAASYRLQPYIMVGINDIINGGSYLSAPVGIGAKFNAKKIMITGQMAYGIGANSNTASSTMYSVGIYIPIKNKKSKQLDKEDNSPYNRPGKDDGKKKDSTNKGGGIVINNYITINMDSVRKVRGLNGVDGVDGRDGADGSDGSGSGSNGKRRGRGNGSGGNGDDGYADGGDGSGGSGGRRKRFPHSFGLDNFSNQEFKIDTINGRPVIRFVIYFEFNEYSLTSKAFNGIDRVIDRLMNQASSYYVEIKGYTDSVGTDAYNNFLSRRRAKMVMEYMNSRGVPSDMMKAKAYGRDNPVGDNNDPNQAWLNRRAEIIISEK